ncbi:MAG: hypothetical protein KA257_01520 [Opitutaceae bacterium]|nr:hypothetical protein [Opitutaceae bacterium]
MRRPIFACGCSAVGFCAGFLRDGTATQANPMIQDPKRDGVYPGGVEIWLNPEVAGRFPHGKPAVRRLLGA